MIRLLSCKLENFREGLFSRNFTYAKFGENKILVKWRNYCQLLMKVNHVIVANFYVANMSFNTFRENKILAKISKFIVVCWLSGCRVCVYVFVKQSFSVLHGSG